MTAAERPRPRRSLALYRWLLRVYPPRFKTTWGTDMEEAFLDLAQEARREAGTLGELRLQVRASLEVLWRGGRARLGGDPGPDRRSPDDRRPRVARWIDVTLHETRHALLSCRATRVTSLLAVLVFALGIGANTIVYSIVRTAVIRELPFPEPELLVDANMVADGAKFAGGATVSVQIAEAWRDHASVFDDVAIYTSDLPVLSGRGDPVRVWSHAVTSNFFELLGADFVAGRGFPADADDGGSLPIVVISETVQRRHFSVGEQIIGATLVLDDVPYDVVGVVADEFRFPSPRLRIHQEETGVVWARFSSARERLVTERRFQGGCMLVARLRVPTAADIVIAELDNIVQRLGAERGDGWATQANVTPLRNYLTGDTTQPLLMLQGAVALVLLIACANVTNLLLARSADRDKELHLRAALGAGRGRLILRLLLECAILSAAGGVLGVGTAYALFPSIVAAGRDALPQVHSFRIDTAALATIALVTFLATLLAGTAPALRAAFRATRDGLAASSGQAATSRSSRTNRTLVMAQVALALVLMTGAGLLLRSLTSLIHVDKGFAAERIVVATLDLPTWAYPDDESLRIFGRELTTALRTVPGALESAISTGLPLDTGMIASASVAHDPDRDDLPWATVSSVSNGYFDLFGLTMHSGDLFDGNDAEATDVVISEAAARAYFSDRDPLGEQMTFGGSRKTYTVVGVVGDVVQDSLRKLPIPHIYVPFEGLPSTYLKVAVRVRGDEIATVETIRQLVRSMGPNVPINRIATMEELVVNSMGSERFYTTLLAGFALSALLIACSGIFGVTSHVVSRATREVGVRMALGATGANILKLIVSRGLGPILVGTLLGVVGALATTRLLQSLLFDVGALDMSTFASATALVLFVATAAAWLPARRAARTDPARAMRLE